MFLPLRDFFSFFLSRSGVSSFLTYKKTKKQQKKNGVLFCSFPVDNNQNAETVSSGARMAYRVFLYDEFATDPTTAVIIPTKPTAPPLVISDETVISPPH